MANDKRYVTVVYEVVDEAECRKCNPLHFEHNGLKAVGAAAADLMQKVDDLELKIDDLEAKSSRKSIPVSPEEGARGFG